MLCSGDYVTMIRSQDHSFDLRKTLVRYATQHGIRAAVRAFAVARNTVRTWVRRHQSEGLRGLRSRSTRPNTSLFRSFQEFVLRRRRFPLLPVD